MTNKQNKQTTFHHTQIVSSISKVVCTTSLQLFILCAWHPNCASTKDPKREETHDHPFIHEIMQYITFKSMSVFSYQLCHWALHYYYQNKVWTIKLSAKSIKPKSKIVSLLEIENHDQNATFGLGQMEITQQETLFPLQLRMP